LESGQYIGRTEYDSPEVDNEVWIDAGAHRFDIGQFVQVRITGATEYDLHGTPAQS